VTKLAPKFDEKMNPIIYVLAEDGIYASKFWDIALMKAENRMQFNFMAVIFLVLR